MADSKPDQSRPILVQTPPPPTDFQPSGGGKPHTNRPDRTRQGKRLDGRFKEIERILDGTSQTTITDELPAEDPELVIVFEVIDQTKTLLDAFRSVGMEPLIDIEDGFDDRDLGPDFTRIETQNTDPDPVKKFIHAALANEQAVKELLRLWNHWKTGKRMISGYGDFTSLFGLLHDIRPWGPRDRVRNMGLDLLLSEQLASNIADLPLNIELWFRSSPGKRMAAESRVRQVITSMGGRTLRSATHPEIGFHGLAAEFPVAGLTVLRNPTDLTGLSEVSLLRASDILFIRPGGQNVGPTNPAETSTSSPAMHPLPSLAPLLAMLDGLPATNHPLLRDRLSVIDPDDISSDRDYTVERRRHGTMVASALIWGDLGGEQPPSRRPLIVRPVLRPDLATQNATEAVSWDQLPADLTIVATRDILSDAPSVQVINVSLGDAHAPFDTIPSAWARALDWLSYEHNLLFIVSAGNHTKPLPIGHTELSGITGEERDQRMRRLLEELSPSRRLLPPAESLNALTVGASHSDSSGNDHPIGYQIDPWGSDGNPSPVSAQGRGIRRAIKPDLLAPGGRQLYQRTMSEKEVTLSLVTRPPGIETAMPPDRTAHLSGSTFAAAEISRRAERLIETMEKPETFVERELRPVAAKALLVHSTKSASPEQWKMDVDKISGFGTIARDLSEGCKKEFATVLFTGMLEGNQRVHLAIPFPHELAGSVELRQITTTLAWLSPINWNHRQYRRAKLKASPPKEIKGGARDNIGPELNLTQRGTVQHRVYETTKAFTATELTFAVDCTAQAGGLDNPVPYAFAVTLKVGSAVGIDVYELVRSTIQVRLRAQQSLF